ncbi:hypothetical protein Glove_562g38 [Diversispora epigaea]|uniref:DNA 3'-5' helicase n=1 Tax=Diversispora epigaea TaxID=1348612 RepID=A0A397GC65_9GLOM|nr:hypothetical protein Glove_562g38 [Diversispora epigaea]
MASKWYTALVSQDSSNRKAYKRSNDSWIVTDFSSGIRVLDIHNEKKAFNFASNIINDVKIAEEVNYNAGYLFQRNKEIEYSLIPLLPGYVVYTSIGNKKFKLSILENNNQLLFFWEEYGCDTSYVNKKAQGFERMAFYYMLQEYGLSSNNSIISILGLNISEINNNLQQFILGKFPTIFQEQLENSKLNNAKKKEEIIQRSLKREQEKIDSKFIDNNKIDNIINGIYIKSDGKELSSKETQVLMLKNAEYKQTIYSRNRTIKTLKEKIIITEKKNIEVITSNNTEIQKLIKKEIDKNDLGSTIFISTSHYLSILFSLLCLNCSDFIVSNRTFKTKVIGFNIICIIKCHICKTSTQYSNEDTEIKFNSLVAGAALAGGINRNSFQTALATIGITNQNCKQTYHSYQTRLYKPIIEYIKLSNKTILLEIINQLKTNNLPSKEKVLPIGFDCSWSHSRNAHQASGEFLYLGNFSGYDYQPVIGFYTVEYSRSSKRSDDDSSTVLYKENFSGTSRQMEHAILIELLNDIMPILEECDFTLHICVDGDLETNRTLACIPAVSRIFADLKHISKNIRKNLYKYLNICKYICILFFKNNANAGLQKNNNQDNAPSEKETWYMQVEGLIQHLLDNHSLCWSDVCWIKDNPELELQEPTLKNYTQVEINNFRNVLTTIFRVPHGQGLVTTFRISYNEAFNRKILKYLDKRIDYWASYCTRHALIVIDQNDGLDIMISKICMAAIGKEFINSDMHNISNFVQERSQQVIRNRNIIQQRNEARKVKFANEKQELAGFDFDKELVSYKNKTIEQIQENIFWPSFGNLLKDFNVIVKCIACHAFAKKSSRGLCGVCSFYVDAGLWEQIIDNQYIPKGKQSEPLEIESLILLAATKIFGFEEFRDGQKEAIISYLDGRDIFVSMKTGGGKTLCYALSAVCSKGLTIIFSPLKALMEDQKVYNPELELQEPTLKNYTQVEINNFRNVLTTIFRVPHGQGLVTTFRISYNEAFNRKILKYLDKRIDYWASYCTRHALIVIDQNDGLDIMISKICMAAIGKEFINSDMHNISNFVQERSQQVIRNRNIIQQRNEARKVKFANEKQELAGFDFDKELVSYKNKTIEQIQENIFWPSFGNLLKDFNVIVKCIACHAFAKKSSRGLCGVCSFYVDAGLWEQIIDNQYIPKGKQSEPLEIESLILLAATKIFGFEEFRDGQKEAIISYLDGRDIFVSMKTGGGKTLCYALSAVCSKGLTIIFSPLKALMEDQKRELINVGIPCATLYANLAQGTRTQEKIFEEIACGLIKVLFVTPEKLISNEGFCRFITQLYNEKKVRFVIDEAHCIIAYHDFSPLKALMEDQKRELINVGIPCATLYANLAQGTRTQEKIFEEIACGLIKVLFVTPEKLISNEGFCRFITQLYNEKKVRFVIDEAHCIIAYHDFRKAWGKLGILKQRWKLAFIMLFTLTATCTRSEVDEICRNLFIEKNNFNLICGSISYRTEIVYNVKERKEIHDQYITEIIDIIKKNLHGRIIIYCSIHNNCEFLHTKLQENLANISIDFFHSGLRDDEREKKMNSWKTSNIQVIVATFAFGMGINSNNIRAVIHVGAPMSMMNLVQESGRAGRDGNFSNHIIFYSKKDIRTNYSIIAEYKEIGGIRKESIAVNEQDLINKLERASNKIFEAWSNEVSPPVCEKCDNCINKITKKPKLLDGKEEIIKLLEVVKFLTQERSKQISPDDIIDVFGGGKTAKVKQKKWDTLPVYPTEKRKVLKTKELISFTLLDLVVRGLVQEKIILRRPNEGNLGLSSSIIIVGVVNGASKCQYAKLAIFC